MREAMALQCEQAGLTTRRRTRALSLARRQAIDVLSAIRRRDRNRQREEILASRAAVGKKIGLGLGGMRLATNQPHQAAATAAKKGAKLFAPFG